MNDERTGLEMVINDIVLQAEAKARTGHVENMGAHLRQDILDLANNIFARLGHTTK